MGGKPILTTYYLLSGMILQVREQGHLKLTARSSKTEDKNSCLKWSLFSGHIEFLARWYISPTPQKIHLTTFLLGGKESLFASVFAVFLLLVSGGMKWVYWLPAFGRWHSGTVAVCPRYPGDFFGSPEKIA